MRNYSDTIFALSTNKAKAALAVFRMSGKDSLRIIKKISNINKTSYKKPLLCYIYDNKNKIDQAVVTLLKKPGSYTGEDMVEISCHGSISIINKISEILLKNNARIAEPGEFTKRSLMNNKLNLVQAETINDLINAETEKQRKIAIDNLTGGLENFISDTTNKISKLLADVEAIIDFSDEELPTEMFKNIREQNKNIIKLIDETINRSLISKKIYTGYQVTVIGKPNTGKSSFINYINNKEVSIVTSLPGTTTDLVTSVLDIHGDKYTFVDTAGIRKYKNIIEKAGIEKSIKSAQMSDLTLVFLQNLEKRKYNDIKNKVFIKSKYDKNKKKTPGIRRISSKTGYGIKGLLNHISKKLRKKNIEGPMFSRERHIIRLENASNYLKKVNLSEIDISAENIRNALKSVQGINEKFDIEKILDIVFADFCIGK